MCIFPRAARFFQFLSSALIPANFRALCPWILPFHPHHPPSPPARTASEFLRGFALQHFCKLCNLKFKKPHHIKFHSMEPDQVCHFPLFHIAETVVDALANCFRPEGSLPHRVCGCRSDWHLLRLLERQQVPAAVISFAFPKRPGLTPCRPGAPPPLLSSCMAETHGSFFRDSQLPGYRQMPVAFSRPIPKVLCRLSQAVIDASSSVPLCSRSPRMGGYCG